MQWKEVTRRQSEMYNRVKGIKLNGVQNQQQLPRKITSNKNCLTKHGIILNNSTPFIKQNQSKHHKLLKYLN